MVTWLVLAIVVGTLSYGWLVFAYASRRVNPIFCVQIMVGDKTIVLLMAPTWLPACIFCPKPISESEAANGLVVGSC